MSIETNPKIGVSLPHDKPSPMEQAHAAQLATKLGSDIGGTSHVEKEGLNIVLCIDNVSCYSETKDSFTMVDQGPLSVLRLPPNEQEQLWEKCKPLTNIDFSVDLHVLMMTRFQHVLCPLVPCLRVAPRHYVFPSHDLNCSIVLPPETSSELVDAFEGFLAQQCTYREGTRREPLMAVGAGTAATPKKPSAISSVPFLSGSRFFGMISSAFAPIKAALRPSTKEEAEVPHIGPQVGEDMDAHLLLTIECAEAFQIKNESETRVEKGPLRILQAQVGEESVVFLVLGRGVFIDLLPSLPCLRMGNAYMFLEGVCDIGIIIDPSTPLTDVELFELLLEQHSVFVVSHAHSLPLGTKKEWEQETGQEKEKLGEEEEKEKEQETRLEKEKLEERKVEITPARYESGARELGRAVIRGTESLLRQQLKKGNESMKERAAIAADKFAKATAVHVSKSVVESTHLAACAMAVSINDAVSQAVYGEANTNPTTEYLINIVKASLRSMLTLYDSLERSALILMSRVISSAITEQKHHGVGSARTVLQPEDTDVNIAASRMRGLRVSNFTKRTDRFATHDVFCNDQECQLIRGERSRLSPGGSIQELMALKKCVRKPLSGPDVKSKQSTEPLGPPAFTA